MYPASTKIGVTIIAVALAGGLVVVTANLGQHRTSAVVKNLPFAAPPQIVHTADWYAAHPDALKADEERCGGDAASIPQAACQNVASADQQLLAAELQQATAANAVAAKSPPPKTP